jgi:D-alanyl-D-alanine carboxypeptidase
MRALDHCLFNTREIELWPARLLRARRSADARALARARWVLRRKRDGAYLAAELPEALLPLLPRLRHEPGLNEALALLEWMGTSRRASIAVLDAPLSTDGVEQELERLGVGADYVGRTGLALVPEPGMLTLAGFDRYRRALWLQASAAAAWMRMRAAALRDGIALEAISGYRSHAYQLGIFRRKLARGLSLAQILEVNAAPGYSEHHSGCALDIGTPGEPPAEESFERTPAFDWLMRNAGEFGFVLSYPRDNPHGIGLAQMIDVMPCFRRAGLAPLKPGKPGSTTAHRRVNQFGKSQYGQRRRDGWFRR